MRSCTSGWGRGTAGRSRRTGRSAPARLRSAASGPLCHWSGLASQSPQRLVFEYRPKLHTGWRASPGYICAVYAEYPNDEALSESTAATQSRVTNPSLPVRPPAMPMGAPRCWVVWQFPGHLFAELVVGPVPLSPLVSRPADHVSDLCWATSNSATEAEIVAAPCSSEGPPPRNASTAEPPPHRCSGGRPDAPVRPSGVLRRRLQPWCLLFGRYRSAS